jgi:hypothetical protein
MEQPTQSKLKHRDIKEYRLHSLSLQNNLCALCQEPIIDDAVLDHDHKTGRIRCVLHRGCNSMLGKIENNMPRSRMSQQRLKTFARNLVDYITSTHTDLLHPTHKEPKMKTSYKKKGGGKRPPKKY